MIAGAGELQGQRLCRVPSHTRERVGEVLLRVIGRSRQFQRQRLPGLRGCDHPDPIDGRHPQGLRRGLPPRQLFDAPAPRFGFGAHGLELHRQGGVRRRVDVQDVLGHTVCGAGGNRRVRPGLNAYLPGPRKIRGNLFRERDRARRAGCQRRGPARRRNRQRLQVLGAIERSQADEQLLCVVLGQRRADQDQVGNPARHRTERCLGRTDDLQTGIDMGAHHLPERVCLRGIRFDGQDQIHW